MQSSARSHPAAIGPQGDNPGFTRFVYEALSNAGSIRRSIIFTNVSTGKYCKVARRWAETSLPVRVLVGRVYDTPRRNRVVTVWLDY